MTAVLEIACFDLGSALDAATAGADRIELCSGALDGGVTPSPGLVEAVRAAVTVPVWTMVRPRGGDFRFSADEHAAMRRDARWLLDAGVDGLVWGAVRADGALDLDALDALLDAVGDPGRVAIHRAFDVAPDPLASLDALMACGIARVLTSGGPVGNAADHLDALARLVAYADGALGGRIAVMPGGGVRASNVTALIAATGAREVHSAARRVVPPGHPHGLARDAVDPNEVRRLDDACRAA